jgi:uncharacterized protein YkwD
MPTARNLALVRAATLCLINRERSAHRERPLREDQRLELAAESHTATMIADGYFGHYGRGGQTPADRLREAGYIPSSSVGYSIGENIAWGTGGLASPRAIVAAWMQSPPHRENILNAEFEDTGIGVAAAVPGNLAEGEPGATYTEDFGVIIRS